METRDIKELLMLMRENINKISRKTDTPGLCTLIADMRDADIITAGEKDKLQVYFDNNIPKNAKIRESRYGMFTSIDGWPLGCFWWSPFSIPPRLKWLNEQIAKL